MIRVFYLLFFFPLVLTSQVFKAGDHSYGYQDIIDTTMNYQMPITNKTYSIDVNNDGSNDFGIQAYHCCGGMGGHNEYINVKVLNTESYIRFGRIDSVKHNTFSYWLVTNVAKPLNNNDTINSINAVWQDSALSLTNNSGSAGTFIDIQDWISSNDYYIGLKHQTATDTTYGWIRVNCPNTANCTIKDMGFEGVFQSIKESKLEKIILYPNPVSHVLQISDAQNQFENSKIDIVNNLGQIILSRDFSTSIDVSVLSEGLYTLRITISGNQSFYSKFIKE